MPAEDMIYGGDCKIMPEEERKPLVSLILTDGYFGLPDPVLRKALPARSTILLLCNESENEVYKTVGRVCRLQKDRKGASV